MPIVASQISLVLSGGSGNTDPKQSLGGSPSAIPIISGQLDNLFDDISSDSSASGITDYRCMYIFNDGNETVYNCQCWVDNQVDEGSTANLGIAKQNEVQRITVTGVVTGGTMTLAYKGHSFTVAYDSNINNWATNIQLLMNGLLDSEGQPILNGVTVSGLISGNNRYFDVTYAGIDGGRDHPMLVYSQNNLIPSGSTINVQLIVQGSPINTVAPEIDVNTTPPAGVTFVETSVTNPLQILKLASGEGFPIWAQRVTPAGANAVSKDGFSMKVRFESLPPV